MTVLPRLPRPGSRDHHPGVWAVLRARAVRLLHRHRPLLVSVLAGLAVLAVVDRVTAAGETVTVLAATRDLPLGEPLSPDLVRPVRVPAALAPSGPLTRLPRDAKLTGAVRSGELLTDRRVSQTVLPPVPAGSVAVPVPLPAQTGRWLHPGQEVLLFTPAGADPVDGGDGARPVRATVLGVMEDSEDTLVSSGVKVVTYLVEVRQAEAAALVTGSDASSLIPVLVS